MSDISIGERIASRLKAMSDEEFSRRVKRAEETGWIPEIPNSFIQSFDEWIPELSDSFMTSFEMYSEEPIAVSSSRARGSIDFSELLAGRDHQLEFHEDLSGSADTSERGYECFSDYPLCA